MSIEEEGMIYKFIDWVFNLDQKPAMLGPDHAKCVVCRKMRLKAEMVRDGSGWFCAKEAKC